MFKSSRNAVKGAISKGRPAAVGVIKKYRDAGGAPGIAAKLPGAAKKVRVGVEKHTKSLINR